MKRIAKYIILIVLFSNIITKNTFSQFSRKGIPYTIQRISSSTVNTFPLPSIDNSTIQAQASLAESTCTSCKNKYYGTGVNVSLDLKLSGQQEVLSDNSKLWLLKISSSTAYGMQFYFDKFHLPYGATLYIYNEDKSSILGAYTKDNNNIDPTKLIQFGTQCIDGNSIYIEYHEPFSPEFEGEIKIKNIVHIFKDIFHKSGPFGESGECNRNVSCSEGMGWEKEINSVVLILAYDPSSNLFAQCSGSLINNVEQDGSPYFLSANHCIDINFPADPCYDPANPYDPAFDFLYDYSNWLFLFNHQTQTCASDGSEISLSTSQSVYGSTLLAKDDNCSPNSDYLLLKLNTTKEVLESYGACYSGWTNLNASGPAPFVGIHHPAGDVKKISFSNSAITSTNYSSSAVGSTFSHWKLEDWDTGVTEGGSSGSPLYNGNHQIVGQLHGGASACFGSVDNAESDWYGKFSSSWQLGNFSTWLDPNSIGSTNISSLCTTSCNDGIQNGNETGIDCGGNCTPCYPGGIGTVCRTVEHTINNHSTQDGNFLNVCKDNIIVRPYSYTNCQEMALWNIAKSELKTTNHIPCNLAGTPPGQPVDCETDLSPTIIGLPDLSCICKYEKLFLSINECDENKNLIGPEYNYWFDCIPISTSTFKDFVLNDYLPPGANIQDGKFYKIKTATTTGGWKEYTSFIKIYSDNLVVENSNLIHDQFSNNLVIQNSNVPSTSNPKIVAKTQIDIIENTTLSSGRYYIDNFDCTTLDQFRSLGEYNSNSNNTQFSEKSIQTKTGILDKKTSESPSASIINNFIQIFPNPTKNSVTIQSDFQIKQINIFNSTGNEIYKNFDIQLTTFKIDLSQEAKGIYLLKIINSKNELIIKKIIKE